MNGNTRENHREKSNITNIEEKDRQPSKGILQTGSKTNGSKTRRISWGEVKIKEFTKNEEVNNRLGDEYNMSIIKVIKEERSEKENDSVIDDSYSMTNFLNTKATQPTGMENKINSQTEIKHIVSPSQKVNNVDPITSFLSNVSGAFPVREANQSKDLKINNLQNPFLNNFNNLPIMNTQIEESQYDFDLLNTGKKRLTVTDIFTSYIHNNTNERNEEKMDKKENQKFQRFENANKNDLNNIQSSKNLTEKIPGINTNNNYTNNNIIAAPKLVNKIYESDQKDHINSTNNLNNTAMINIVPINKNQEPSQVNLPHGQENSRKQIISTSSDPNNANRLTINIREQIQKHLSSVTNNKDSSDSEKDKSITKNKRFTISLQDAISTLYNNQDDEEDSENSLEKRIKERRDSNISASPINIKTQKLYYETCLSSASRCIETTEAKNNEKEKTKEEKDNDLIVDRQNKENSQNVNRITLNNIIPSGEEGDYIIGDNNQQETPKFEEKTSRITINQIFAPEPNILIEKSPLQSKNPIIKAHDLISPLTTNFSLLKIGQDQNDVDKRINDLMLVIAEINKMKSKNNQELEKGIAELTLKLKEFTEEQLKIQLKKNQIKEEIEQIDRESILINERKMILSFPMNFFGIRVLSSELNRLKLQLFKRVNINFNCKEFSAKWLKQIDHGREKTLIIEKINFDVIKDNPDFTDKLIEDPNLYKIIKNIYEDILNFIIKPDDYRIVISAFHEKIKYIIKYTSSYLYLLEILSLILCIGMEFSFKYVKESMSALVQFTLLNKFGFKVIFVFEFEVLNSFFGVNYKDSSVVNISLSETNFSKYKSKTNSFVEEVKKFLSFKEKLMNPIFLKEFLLKLNENILNL